MNRLYRLYNLTIPTANRLSHERFNNTNIIISSKNYAISTVLWISEPSGTVAQCLGFQDIWDIREPQGTSGDVQGSSVTSGMTLWHAGTLLACWHNWQTHGTQTNDDHHPLNLVDFRLQAVVVGLQFSGFTGFVMICISEAKLRNRPNPKNRKIQSKMAKNRNLGLYE